MAFKSTHKEALAAAQEAWFDNPIGDQNIDMEAAIRAYLKDRGAKIVPLDPTDEMIIAGVLHENMGDMAGRYRAMLSASPDPFTDEVAG